MNPIMHLISDFLMFDHSNHSEVLAHNYAHSVLEVSLVGEGANSKAEFCAGWVPIH